jgi:hypothetical protein
MQADAERQILPCGRLRVEDLRYPIRCVVAALLTGLMLSQALAAGAAHVLVEAESFERHGGWVLDTQFIPIMGSSYLLAHGLGRPVADATTTVAFPTTGNYRVFVRTKDWVAPWKAPGTPGRFQLLVDGTPLKETFGTRGADWFWHDGGTVEIKRRQVTLALRDLTGFDGRCDAVLFTTQKDFTPPNDSSPKAAWRRELSGLGNAVEQVGQFDLVVVGGGYAGTCAAVSAARMGCRVALIQDRPVLGGNGSSEIRVWPQGGTRRGLFPRLGEIVEELVDRPTQSPARAEEWNDAKREAIVRAEKNLSLFLNHHVIQVETNDGRIVAVVALDTRSGRWRRFAGTLFADCTGHGTIGHLAGADERVQEKGRMGMSNMWRWEDTDAPQPFPETPWALDLAMKDFPYPVRNHGEWFWESGFDADPIRELELTRDWNLRAVFGAFNAMKNRDGREKHRNARLEWVAYIGGTRESRQLLGDVVLTREDIAERRRFEDGCVPTTWDIDLHYPKEQYTNAYPENPFISRAVFDKAVDRVNGYPVPYRCFYSRNVPNLFMAGRCISVTHEALGTVRVMKTGGMMGEVVGKAASLCLKHDRAPRDLYPSHFEELKALMNQPGVARRDTVHSPIYIPPGATVLPLPEVVSIDPAKLEGTVIDDTQARLEGNWQSGQGLKGFVGERYLYHGPKGNASARYDFTVPTSGNYEVRLSYQAHTNRASNARVIVNSARGADVRRVNQRVPGPLPNGFFSLGAYEFKAGETNSVLIENKGADGFVNVDAVQVVPRRLQQ